MIQLKCSSLQVQFVASTEVELGIEGVEKVNKLIDELEDSDDVQNVYHNMIMDEEARAHFESEED